MWPGQVVRQFGDVYEYAGTPEDYTLHYWAAGIHFGVKKTSVVWIRITEPILNSPGGRP